MIPNFWADHRVSIMNGIDYLNNRGHVVGLPPGPGACSRFSCADDSGIYGTCLSFLELYPLYKLSSMITSISLFSLFSPH